MMYHQTKFGCEMISSLEDILEMPYFYYTSLHCHLDLERPNQFIFAWHSSL